MTDEDSWVRVYVAEALGRIGTEEAFAGLLLALKDTIPSVRRGAIKGLEKIGTEKAVTELLLVLKDAEFSVRQHAGYALRRIASYEILPDLTKLLQTTGERHLLDAITAIQTRCKFYNYEIAQSSRPALPNAEYLNSLQGLTIMTDKQPIINFNQSNATVGVNYAAENSNIKFQQNVKNISEQDLGEAAKKIQSLLNQLAQTYPPTTEPQQQTFIQKFIEQLESTPDLIKVILAGGIEGVKILCPTAGIPIEMSRRLYEAVQKHYSQT